MSTPISRIRLDAILPLVYDELRSCASRALLNERHDHTFQTTELVHETYVRLANLREIDWDNKKVVLRAAVAVMRGSFHMILKQIGNSYPTPLRQLNDQIPKDLESICLKALSTEPKRRYDNLGFRVVLPATNEGR